MRRGDRALEISRAFEQDEFDYFDRGRRPDVMYAGMELSPYAWIYFVSFVVLGTFMVLNLFIAILLNNLDEAKAAAARESLSPVAHDELLDAIHKTQETLEDLKARMDAQEKAIASQTGGTKGDDNPASSGST